MKKIIKVRRQGFEMPSMWSEIRAQGEFNSLYMILVLIIAALLLITVVKPMFRQSQSLGSKTPVVGS
jgi:competence protein ComGC